MRNLITYVPSSTKIMRLKVGES